MKNNIDVEQMQSDIRQYKSLEEDARQIQERIACLKEIQSISQSYEREKEKYQQQKFIVIRAQLEEHLEQERACMAQIQEKEQLIQSNLEAMSALREENLRLKRELEKLEDEFQGSDIVRREKDLKRRIQELDSQIRGIRAALQEALAQTNSYGKQWAVQLEKARNAVFVPSGDYGSLMEQMAVLTEDQIWDFPFGEAAGQMEHLRRELEEYRAELKKRGEQLKESRQELEATIRNLKNGIKPFPPQVQALKRLLEEELFRLHKKAVDVSVLADLLEIRNPRWRNAIEGYLDQQKFYLLVPEEYYGDALAIYDRQKKEQKIWDAGLVDIGKLRRNFSKKPMEGSLAEEIENKGFVSRKLNPARYASPFIGRRSMELLPEQKQAELETQNRLYEEVLGCHRVIAQAAVTGILSDYEAARHQEAVERRQELEELSKTRNQVQQEYDNLDFLYLDRMRRQIEELKGTLSQKEQSWHSLDKENTRCQTQLEGLKSKDLPEIIGQITKVRDQIQQEFDPAWIQETGEPRFAEVQGQQGDYSQSLRERFFSAMRQTEISRDRLRSQRTRKRSEYNSQYKMPYDIELESNQYFDKELEELDQIRLPEYLEKIRDSKQKAYDQFRDDFIAKIKSNIEAVTQQLEELNDSLKKSVFGTDRYRFVKSPRPEYRNYYDMIMDPLLMDTGGWNIASQSFNQKYQKEIDELFQLLIFNETNVTAERRAEYEKSIRKFTDYKTYLVFDLIVTDEQGNEQHLSRTLLKKSGGETQIPFYIALLASFSQVCRIRNRSQNNTIRVIILDEAFSKMDGERIQESIHLLRRFGLQAIFSAPPDKIPDIAPLVDRNIAVYKDSRHSFTRYFDPKQIEELVEA